MSCAVVEYQVTQRVNMFLYDGLYCAMVSTVRWVVCICPPVS